MRIRCSQFSHILSGQKWAGNHQVPITHHQLTEHTKHKINTITMAAIFIIRLPTCVPTPRHHHRGVSLNRSPPDFRGLCLAVA